MQRPPRWVLVPLLIMAIWLTWLTSSSGHGSAYSAASPISPLVNPVAYLPVISHNFNPMQYHLYVPILQR